MLQLYKGWDRWKWCKLKGRKIDIEVPNINIKEVDTASEEYPKTNVKDENIIDMEDISMGETNE